MHICDIQIRDPFVVAENGSYYLFGSTDKDIWKSRATGFDVYVSRQNGSPRADLTSFDGPYPAFRPPGDFWAQINFWAPEVYYYKGSYYMFATFKPKEGRRGTAVLKSGGGVMGPYMPWSLNAAGEPGPVTPAGWECLDGTFFVEQGQPYMIFCREWQQVGDGQICAVPLADDLSRAAAGLNGEPASVVLFRASEAPWAYELKGRAPGSYVTDGPFMYRTKDGGLFMLWSSFGRNGNYCIGTARSESGLLRGPWIQSREPLHCDDGGHGMLFRAGDGCLYLAIHRPNKTPHERLMLMEVTESGGTIAVHGGRVIS